jgi:hypothetical protein
LDQEADKEEQEYAGEESEEEGYYDYDEEEDGE